VDLSQAPVSTVEIKDTFDVLAQTIAIIGRASSQTEVRGADIVIRPDMSEVGTIDFAAKQHAIEMGETAAQENMPKISALLKTKGRY